MMILTRFISALQHGNRDWGNGSYLFRRSRRSINRTVELFQCIILLKPIPHKEPVLKTSQCMPLKVFGLLRCFNSAQRNSFCKINPSPEQETPPVENSELIKSVKKVVQTKPMMIIETTESILR